MTLARLESVLGGSEAAAAYVRAVRDRRYARAARRADAARSAARCAASSARASACAGVLRAWWALPPLLLGALKDRRRRPYTQK